MADDMDRAQAREAYDRELALAATLRRMTVAMGVPGSDGRCLDCDDPIAPARIAALAPLVTNRCAPCAQRHEQEAHR